jgi:hypothetical protein
LAAETLSAGQVVLVPDVGHGVIRSSTCVAQMAAAYLDALSQPARTMCPLPGRLTFYVPRDQIGGVEG